MLNLNKETYSCCNLSFNICVYMADLKTRTYSVAGESQYFWNCSKQPSPIFPINPME